MSRTRVALAVGFGLLLVRLAFALMVPPGSAPDEPEQFIKAFGAARLDFGNTSNVGTYAQPSDMDKLNQSLGAYIDMGSHPIDGTWTCNAGQPEHPANCLDSNLYNYPREFARTSFGSFQPFVYVVIGLPSLFIDDPDTSMLGMRLVIVAWTTLLTSFGLIVIARRYGNRGVLASIVGWTPMVLYTQGTLGTSGIEIASAFALLASGLDVLGGPASTRGSRAVLIVASVTLLLTRPLSVAIFAVVAVLVVLIIGRREARRRVVALPLPYSVVAMLCGVVAVALNLGWSLTRPPVYLGHSIGLMHGVGHFTLETAPRLWHMVIGTFEWLDTDLPLVAVIAAWAAICSVLAWSSDRRDRAATVRLWFVIAATVAFAFFADYTVFERVGGYVQGRHVLPLFQLWPLAALLPGQVGANVDEGDGRRLTPLRLATLVMGVVTGVSWLYVARREAVGILGPLNFFGNAAWHPAVGWVLPVSLLTIGLVMTYVPPVAAGMMSSGRTESVVRGLQLEVQRDQAADDEQDQDRAQHPQDRADQPAEKEPGDDAAHDPADQRRQ